MSESSFLRKELAEARKEIEFLQKELDYAYEIHFDELKDANRCNFWLTGAIVFLVMWIATTP